MKTKPSEPPGKRLNRNKKLSLSNPRAVSPTIISGLGTGILAQRIPSVNFHLWEPCNMRCRFCFATFQDVKHSILPKGHLPKEQALEVVYSLAAFGFQKITFAGGEPTLCPWLHELIKAAKEAGMTTMIVTNGSKLDNSFLEQNRKYLDWIAISVDSLDHGVNLVSGRAIAGNRPLSEEYYRDLIVRVKDFGFRLKINTVVHARNQHEDLVDFLGWAKPERWKVLQVLPIEGQNDVHIHDYTIDALAFQEFKARHYALETEFAVVYECTDEIKGSYAMVDPAGRFFDDAEGKHRYSRPILKAGCAAALKEVQYSYRKFIERGGVYDWECTQETINPLGI